MKSSVLSLLEGLKGLENYKYYVVYFDKDLKTAQWVGFEQFEQAEKLMIEKNGVIVYGEYIKHSKKDKT